MRTKPASRWCGDADPPTLALEVLRGPDLLSFADLSPVEVPTLPIEQHVAEKVHAYSRAYARGRTSSRVKDLVDLAAIAALFPFEAGRPRHAIRLTFNSRGSHPAPLALPPPPSGWESPYRKLAIETGFDPDLSAGYEQARRFLDPILAGTVLDHARWDATGRTW